LANTKSRRLINNWRVFNMNNYLNQKGQALPLALAFFAIVAAVVFFMFNSGQLVQEKMRITNTADAVAYSAGVYEARVLNYDAYTNRAIIANEIAIGQAVGLGSWAKYSTISADNIGNYVQYIPYVGQAIKAALDYYKGIMSQAVIPYLPYVIEPHDLAIRSLLASQDVMHGPANSVALANRKVVMDKVAYENDPDVKVDTVPIGDDFQGFTQKYTTKNARKRMGVVVSDSREQFLKSRNWQFGMFGCVTYGLKKRGSTELIGNVDGWKSMDTLSFWYWKPKWYNPCRKKELPLGYATAFSKNQLNDSAYSYAGSRNTNPKASGYADSVYGQADGFAPQTTLYGAIPEFYDLSSSALSKPDPVTRIAIRVTKDESKQHYSGGVGAVMPAGQLALYNGDHAKKVTAAISKVEVYFERPDGANNVANGAGKAELGSLFNPYWQVRLVSPSTAERAFAQFKQGLVMP
jgi:hypothetical protein